MVLYLNSLSTRPFLVGCFAQICQVWSSIWRTVLFLFSSIVGNLTGKMPCIVAVLQEVLLDSEASHFSACLKNKRFRCVVIFGIYVTLDHKTSLKCTFFEIEVYRSSESWINKLSIDVWFVMIGHNIWLRYNYLKILDLRVQKNLNIEKFAFKVVQMKFLAVHDTTNQKWSWYIYGKTFIKYLHGTWSLINILRILGINYKSIMFNHKMAIATIIPQRLRLV